MNSIRVIRSHRMLSAILVLSIGMTAASCSFFKKTRLTDQQKLSEKEKTDFSFLYINASKEKMLGNIDLATNLYHQCIKINPGDPSSYYELASIFRLKKKHDEALFFAKKAAELSPDNYWYQILYADCLSFKGRFKDAAEVLQKLIRARPYQKNLYFVLAGTYLQAGNVKDAISVYDKMEDRFEMSDEISMQKINVYKQTGDFAALEKELIRLTGHFPSEAKYHGMLAELYMDKGMKDKAYDVLSKFLETDPEHPYIRLLLAEYYRGTGQEEKSYEEVKRAFKNRDLDIDTKVKMLLSYYEITERYPELKEKAFELCSLLVETHYDDAKAHSIYGDFLYREKKYAEARDQFRLAISYDKEKFVLWNQLLILDAELNDYESMLKESGEIMELFPSQPSPYLYHAVANIQFKKYEEALSALKEGLPLVTDNKLLLSQFYSNIGDVYNRLKKYKESDDAYEKALQTDPDNVYVLNNYSYYLSLRRENLERAASMSKKSLEVDPDNVSYMDTYGWILYQQGKFESAKLWIEKAIFNGAGKNGVILEHYGDILFRLGDKEKAWKQWNEAKQNGGGSDVLDKKITNKELYE